MADNFYFNELICAFYLEMYQLYFFYLNDYFLHRDTLVGLQLPTDPFTYHSGGFRAELT